MKNTYYACSVCSWISEPCIQIVIGESNLRPDRCNIKETDYAESKWVEISKKTVLLFLQNELTKWTQKNEMRLCEIWTNWRWIILRLHIAMINRNDITLSAWKRVNLLCTAGWLCYPYALYQRWFLGLYRFLKRCSISEVVEWVK